MIEQGTKLEIHLVTDAEAGGHGQIVYASVQEYPAAVRNFRRRERVEGVTFVADDDPLRLFFIPLEEGIDPRLYEFIIPQEGRGLRQVRATATSIEAIVRARSPDSLAGFDF